jgi:hypothetical protein
LPDLRLASPLALFVAHHERSIDEHHGITVSGCVVHPGDRLLDAACPASVNDLARPVDNRHARLVRQKVPVAFSPGKVNTQKAHVCHPNVVPHRLSSRLPSAPRFRRSR